MACLGEDAVLDFVTGAAGEEAEAHVAGCNACREIVAEVARFLFEDDGAPTAGAAGEPLPPGARVARYVILETVGTGAAGVVYRARDPQLNRDVALKVLRARRAELLREAQALARLSHPHIVAVHDVGVHDGRVFIVMELVDGVPLSSWLAAATRPWPAVLDLFAAAGAGLAAAHAAGLVHRDFKPENVVVGRDGRVRLADFGLATATPLGGPRPVGTPAYMAPEQLRGEPATARADQFGFCVALYAALYARHPFLEGGAPATFVALAEAVGSSAPHPPPADSPVPRAVWQVLARGLQPSPEERHASMDELLAALARAARGPRRRRAGIAAALLVTGAVAATFALARPVGGAACGDGVVQPGEECDDGNDREGDGCSASCLRCGGAGELSWSNGHCYSLHAEALPWAEARVACGRRGGDLVTYTAAPEAFAVSAGLLAGAPALTWIGLHDEGAGDFRWATGEAMHDQWWGPGEPRAGARCVRQRLTAPERGERYGARWETAPCEEPAAHLCERAPWRRRARDGHRYKVFTVAETWEGARRACEAAGARLVSIEDAEEQSFVAALAAPTVWIGAHDGETEGAWLWAGGGPVRFQAFAPGEPFDPDGTADCAVLGTDRLWHDRSCDDRNAFVCEIDR